jgi:acyl transferase domain-containing protein
MRDGTTGSEIAIIGMSCLVPGANTVEQFWDNLCAGRESISFFSTRSSRPPGFRPRC